MAEKALMEKEKNLPNPMGDRIIDLEAIIRENPNTILDSDLELES